MELSRAALMDLSLVVSVFSAGVHHEHFDVLPLRVYFSYPPPGMLPLLVISLSSLGSRLQAPSCVGLLRGSPGLGAWGRRCWGIMVGFWKGLRCRRRLPLRASTCIWHLQVVPPYAICLATTSAQCEIVAQVLAHWLRWPYTTPAVSRSGPGAARPSRP